MDSTKRPQHFKLLTGLLLLFLCNPFTILCQSHDPHRGMQCGNFASFTPQSLNDGYPKLNINFSVLGNSGKEDSLLEYAGKNHITSLSLYDLYAVFRYNDTPNTQVNGVKLVELLCNFMSKARNLYCINEIGVTGGIDSFFFDATSDTSTTRRNIQSSPALTLDSLIGINIQQNDSALYYLLTHSFNQGDSLLHSAMLMKFFYDVLFRQSSVCNYYFDFLCYENEWWNSGNFNSSLLDLQHMRTLEVNYNATHLHPLQTSVYVRSSFNGTVSPAQQAIINQLDGTANNLLPRLADRILAVHYGVTPAPCYINYGGQIPGYADPLTNGGTDYHPYFSTETNSMGIYIDYLGVWLRNKFLNNIFVEEKDFYDRWRIDDGANFGSASDNTIEPGGAEYFQSYFMVDSLKNPRTFRTNSPICTNGTTGDTLRFTYQGPLERDITYQLKIYNSSQVLISSDTGRTGDYPLIQTNLLLPNHFLTRNGSPYRVDLILNYGGCSYSFTDSVFVNNGPTIYATSPSTFCQGGNLFLQASAGNVFSWFRNDTAITGGQIISVNQSGNYYCQITGNGTCNGNSNHILVNVLANPDIVFSTNCFNTDSAQIRVTSPGNHFSWITGDTTSSIIAKTYGGYRYYVTVTQSNQCQRTSYKIFSIPIASFTANPHISTRDLLRSACSHDSIQLTPTQYSLGCQYNWTYNQTSLSTCGDYFVHPAPGSSFQIMLHMINESGCDGYDTAIINIYHCCSAQDTTIFGSDSTSHYSNWANRTLNIAGDLIINSNFTISTSSLLMDSSSKIIILSGKTLTIQNSRLSSCSNMWRGISFADNTSLLIMNGDTIEDAYQAISDSAGGKFTISNMIFNKNRRGIVVVGSNTALSSTITNCTFTSENNAGIAVLTKYSGGAYCGIEMSGMAGWNIGGTGNHISFKHMNYGIRADASSIIVTNCSFNDMRRFSNAHNNPPGPFSFVPYDGYGIFIQNSTTVAKSLVVNNSTFLSCGYGVGSFNGIGNEIKNSNFDSLHICAIYISNPTANILNIHNNSFNHICNGIDIREGRLATSIDINDNVFDHPRLSDIPMPVINSPGWSIKILNILQGTTRAHIKNNHMNNQYKGIYLNGCEEPEISSNVIQLQGRIATVYNQFGILIVKSPIATISQDSVLTTTIGTYNPNIRGIRFESSTDCNIKDNYLLNLTAGINGLNLCDHTYLSCNDFYNCTAGISLFNITLPIQGSVGHPQDNRWYNIALANRTVGSGNAISFYHRYTQNNSGNKFSPGTNPFILISIPNIIGQSLCEANQDTIRAAFSDVTDDIIQDSVFFPLFNPENKWYAREYAFKLLSKDSTLMDQGLPTDSQRQRFFDELRVRNIGQLYEIRRALEDKDYLQVITDLLTIQPENVIETNYKTIYGKMESVLRYDSSLTPDDSLEIKEIASQLACEGGPAVYMARAILDEEYDDELTASLYKIRAATSTMEEVIIFPNPTSGVVTISKDLSGYSGCSFDVFDFHGKHCNSSVLDVTINPIQKDLSTLKNGIYFLRIHCDGIVINTMKLIIIK